MENYEPQKIEKKWQEKWKRQGIFEAKDSLKKPKFYCLDMFPYPSGEGLHVGHPRGYIATDIISHFMRRKGFNVLHPMGWDAFGLPAENYAIKTGIHPEISTKKNIKRFREQMDSIGLSYDWSREINTTDPEYYKWTQWIFLLLYKMGLAYEAVLPINFCPSCKTGLANEEVIDDKCERCGAKVVKKNLRQWVLKITAYADRLLEGLRDLDWPEKIITMQKNWIGKSEGWDIKFPISNFQFPISVFTTRVDTLFGCTYLVIAPEHPLIRELKSAGREADSPKGCILNLKSVENYIEKARQKSERERISEVKDKSGVELKGILAQNPVNKREIPIFVADYVLMHYGKGAIMAVPGHDQRDFDFAKRYNLPILEVIASQINTDKKTDLHGHEKAYEGEGILISSGRFNGMKSVAAKTRIGEWLAKQNLAEKAVNFKLRDWIFSRQRYWGEPIPLVHCQKCGIVPLPEKYLPLKLPKVEKYQPTGTGESPLAGIEKWVNTACPKCKGPAKRETNTMPQWAGSCWYFLRYADPKNNKKIADPKKLKYWLAPARQSVRRSPKGEGGSPKGVGGVDLYVGGAEHAVLHLLYSRFWLKVLYDAGAINFEEPFLKLRNQGLILAPDGQKMSKSRGNVISPDEIIKKYGADTLRLYEMFMGPFEDAITWDTKGIEGCYRFLQKVWRLAQKIKEKSAKVSDEDIKILIHKTIKKVTSDIENFKFNTAISSLMILVNKLAKQPSLEIRNLELVIKLLAPFAPHITEEIWSKLGFSGSIHFQEWPKFNPNLIKEEKTQLIIQINGKVRDKIELPIDILEVEAKEIVLNREKIKKWLENKKIKKVIFVKGKLINIVTIDKS